jgi:ABC-2 type transport system permease protein
MNAIWIIAEREVRGFFSSILAYVLLVVWLVYQGVVFVYAFQTCVQQGFSPGQGESPITFVLGGWIFFYIISVAFVPAFTMRFIADEYRSGNIESILSTPNTEVALILGKFLAGLIIWIALWIPTLIYVWLTSRFGSLDLGATSAAYIGVLGVGAHYVAIGVLASTIARTQLTAFLLSFMMLTLLFILGIGAMVFGEGPLGEAAGYISVWEHMSTFGRGIVDTRYLTFDLTMTVLPLFVAHRILVARRLA